MKPTMIEQRTLDPKELKAMGIKPEDPKIQQHLIERASLISVLKSDQERLSTEVGELRDVAMPFQIQHRRMLEVQLDGLEIRLRNAIVLDVS